MIKKDKKTKANELSRIKKLLSLARNRHDNKILEVEKIWAGLKPTDYKKRKLVIEITDDLIKIDKSIKKWESKLTS